MRNFFASITRSSAFFRKEIVEVLRQPRLILSLILGPFLILLLFGAGYRNEPRSVRTLFVADPESPMAQQVEEFAPNISPQLIYAGIVGDESTARASLARGEVELVVVTPENAYDTIRANQQAEFVMYHNEIDPAQIGYIDYLGQTLVEEINRRVLSTIATEGQQEARDVQADVKSARENAASMRQALEAGDSIRARQHQTSLQGDLSNLSLAIGASAGVLSGVEQNVGPGQTSSNPQDILALLNSLQDRNRSNEIQEGQTSYAAEISELQQTEAELEELDVRLTEFQSISPQILVRPFRATSQGISTFVLSPTDFFTPGVIVLLLQHIAVTIASLSIVRERRSGAMELFRVSPISSGETLLGKYVSYILFGAILAAVLSLLLYFGLRVPMLGSWYDYALIVFLVLFASLGLGFLVSLLAETESQAVQLAMIILLLSVFFSGFMLDLRYLWGPVKIVSWMLPATYGTLLLQNIMLRGASPVLLYIGGLLAIGLVLLIISWLLMRRRMARE